METASLVVFESPNGRDGWVPIKPDAVPEWLKASDVMARLVAGEICMKADEGDKGSNWYCAEHALDLERIIAAEQKRARKQRARLN